MRFTRSKDGVERATVLVPMRFTREEVTWLRRHARSTSVRDLLAGWLNTWLWERRAEDAAHEERWPENELDS